MDYQGTDFYCVLAISGKIELNKELSEEDMPILLEIVEVIKKLAAKVQKERGAARILTNLGEYQDSKHLHFHISSGEPLR